MYWLLLIHTYPQVQLSHVLDAVEKAAASEEILYVYLIVSHCSCVRAPGNLHVHPLPFLMFLLVPHSFTFTHKVGPLACLLIE